MMVPITSHSNTLFRNAKTRIRVLLLVTDLDIGGTPLQVYNIARGLRNLHADVTLACLGQEGDVAKMARNTGFEAFCLGARSATDVAVLVRLAKLIRRIQPDIVHSFLVHANVAARITRWIYPRAKCVTTVCTAERETLWHLTAENVSCRLSDCMVCISDAVRFHMIRNAAIPASQIAVIKPGVDTENLLAQAPADRAELAADPTRKILTFIGRLDPVKCVNSLLLTVKSLATSENVAVAIVGDGPEREKLEAIVRQENLSDRVRFLGFRRDVGAILKASDVFVLPSRMEGWSIATTEALAVGVPVVATRVAGPTEQITDGVNGVLVNPNDVNSLAAGIVRGLRLPRRTPSTDSQSIQRLDVRRESAEYLQLYRDVIEGTFRCKAR